MDDIKWAQSEVIVRPTIATDSLSNDKYTIDERSAATVSPLPYVDGYEYDGKSYLDCSHLLKDVNTSTGRFIMIDEYGANEFILHLVVYLTQELYENYFPITITIINQDSQTTRKLNYTISEWKLLWIDSEAINTGPSPAKRAYYASHDFVYNSDSIIQSIQITNQGYVTISETNTDILSAGISKLYLRRKNALANVDNYSTAHHYNSMLVVPKLYSTSSLLRGLLNSAGCLPSSNIVDLRYSYEHIKEVGIPYFVYYFDADANYVLFTSSVFDVDLYLRDYAIYDGTTYIREVKGNRITNKTSTIDAYPFHAYEGSYIRFQNLNSTPNVLMLIRIN